jgi:hypothetical protein
VHPHDLEENNTSRALRYLSTYLKQQGIRAYWGEVEAFCAELDERWRSFVEAR